MIKELTMEIKTLAGIGSIFNGNSINAKVKKEKYLNIEDGIPYIATKDVSYRSIVDYKNGIKIPFVEKSNFKIAPKNTILICAEGGSAGRKIGFTNQEVCFGNKLFAFTPKKGIDSKYVYYFYFSDMFQKDFQNLMTGIIGGVSMNKFKNISIPIPPLPQQKQIVAILDKAFAAIDTAKANAEKNLQNAKELFESYLQNVFENKGDDWYYSELNEFVNFIDYRGRTPVKTSSGVRLITAKNIKLGYLQVKPEEFIAEDNYESWMTRGIPNFGDVIFTTEAPLGNIAQVNTNDKIAFAQRVIVMQPDPKKINQTFLKYLLLSNPIRNKILSQATGATVLGIKSRLLKKIEIDFPNSIEEQKQIVEKLDTLSAETKKLEAIYTQKLADLEEMKKSILQKAFSGQLNTIN